MGRRCGCGQSVDGRQYGISTCFRAAAMTSGQGLEAAARQGDKEATKGLKLIHTFRREKLSASSRVRGGSAGGKNTEVYESSQSDGRCRHHSRDVESQRTLVRRIAGRVQGGSNICLDVRQLGSKAANAAKSSPLAQHLS